MLENPSEKIVSQGVLRKIVQDLKQHGSIIVTTNGSFDLLHIGHVTMLQEARLLGDVLIVGMNSDASVKGYKGRYRPICPQEHRAEMLAALDCTDYITLFDELTPIKFLQLVRPNIHVNSPEHGYKCIEREVVEQYGGRIHLARLIEGISTSQLIQRILEASSHEVCKGIFVNSHDLLQENQEEMLDLLKRFKTLGFHVFTVESSDNVASKQIRERLQQEEIELRDVPRTSEETWDVDKIIEDYDISLAKSFIISSEMKDIQRGRELNCKTILLKKQTIHIEKEGDITYLDPNYTIEDFRDAVKLLTTNFS